MEDILRCLALLDRHKKGAFFIAIVRELFGMVMKEEGIAGINDIVLDLVEDIMTEFEVAHWIVSNSYYHWFFFTLDGLYFCCKSVENVILSKLREFRKCRTFEVMRISKIWPYCFKKKDKLQ